MMQQRTPLVTVITPAYNASKHIAEAIESILVQTCSDFEYVLIDDGSSDDTFARIMEYAKQDRRIRPFRNGSNLGVGATRNIGLCHTVGQFVAWLDADDIALPLRLERQSRFLRDNPEIGAVGGFLECFASSGRTSIRTYSSDDASLRRKILRYSPISHGAAMFRATAYDKVGKYRSDLIAEDLDMLLRLGKYYKYANLQEVVLRYRETPSSLTSRQLNRLQRETYALRRCYAQSGQVFRVTWLDRLHINANLLSIYLMPTRVRMQLFDAVRNRNAS